MTEITATLVVSVPIILALVQLVRTTFPAVPANFLPMLSIAFGIGLSFIASAAEIAGTDPNASAASLLLSGLIVGLSASGLYSGAKAVSEPVA